MKLREKLKSCRKVISVVGLSVALLCGSSVTVFADASTALTQAKTDVVNQVKPIVNNAAIPIIIVLLVAGLAFAIGHAVYNYKKGREIELGWIIALLIGIILLGTFSVWGWSIASV